MARLLLEYVVPFLTPMAVYAIWVWYRTGYAARHGGAGPRIEKGPWPLLVFLGALSAFATLGLTGFLQASPADSDYVPPHVEKGEVIPGHFDPKIAKPK